MRKLAAAIILLALSLPFAIAQNSHLSPSPAQVESRVATLLYVDDNLVIDNWNWSGPESVSFPLLQRAYCYCWEQYVSGCQWVILNFRAALYPPGVRRVKPFENVTSG